MLLYHSSSNDQQQVYQGMCLSDDPSDVEQYGGDYTYTVALDTACLDIRPMTNSEYSSLCMDELDFTHIDADAIDTNGDAGPDGNLHYTIVLTSRRAVAAATVLKRTAVGQWQP